MTIKDYSSPDTLVMYGLDAKAWRDVRVDTIHAWSTGYPKEQSWEESKANVTEHIKQE